MDIFAIFNIKNSSNRLILQKYITICLQSQKEIIFCKLEFKVMKFPLPLLILKYFYFYESVIYTQISIKYTI